MLKFIAAESPEARRASGFGAAPAADGAVLASPKPAAVADGAQAVADNTAARVSTLAKMEFALEDPAAATQENRDSDLSLSPLTAHRRASHRTDAVLTTAQHAAAQRPQQPRRPPLQIGVAAAQGVGRAARARCSAAARSSGRRAGAT